MYLKASALLRRAVSINSSGVPVGHFPVAVQHCWVYSPILKGYGHVNDSWFESSSNSPKARKCPGLPRTNHKKVQPCVPIFFQTFIHKFEGLTYGEWAVDVALKNLRWLTCTCECTEDVCNKCQLNLTSLYSMWSVYIHILLWYDIMQIYANLWWCHTRFGNFIDQPVEQHCQTELGDDQRSTNDLISAIAAWCLWCFMSLNIGNHILKKNKNIFRNQKREKTAKKKDNMFLIGFPKHKKGVS